jgi:hypothetical protein
VSERIRFGSTPVRNTGRRWPGLAVTAVLGLLAVATSVGGQSCANREEVRLPSPDGAWELVLFIRLCGTAYTGEVAIVAKGAALPGGPGNVPLPDHPENAGARWLAADSVVITSPTASPSTQEFRVDGVKVRYVRQ